MVTVKFVRNKVVSWNQYEIFNLMLWKIMYVYKFNCISKRWSEFRVYVIYKKNKVLRC